MADWEEVIKGLECCNRATDHYPCDVPECPYREWHESCMDMLRDDAISILKPRVMTLEEARALDKESVIWFENKRLHSIYPRIVRSTCPTGVEFSDGAVWTYKSDGYNTTWRCWTAKPDEKVRAETPWET